MEDELCSSKVLNLWAGFSSPKKRKLGAVAGYFLHADWQELFHGK
jgi:hypothetical protein